MYLLVPGSDELAALLQLGSLLHLSLLSQGSLLLGTSQLGLMGSPHLLCPLICCCCYLQSPVLYATETRVSRGDPVC